MANLMSVMVQQQQQQQQKKKEGPVPVTRHFGLHMAPDAFQDSPIGDGHTVAMDITGDPTAAQPPHPSRLDGSHCTSRQHQCRP